MRNPFKRYVIVTRDIYFKSHADATIHVSKPMTKTDAYRSSVIMLNRNVIYGVKQNMSVRRLDNIPDATDTLLFNDW